MTKYIAPPLGLINPDHLKDDEKFLIEIKYEMFPEDQVRIFRKGGYLVIHTIFFHKLKKIWAGTQKEYPLHALPWIVDRFENGFFKPQDQGGVSNFERSLRKEFNGELIGINAMAHCCAENLPGFNIWNANRTSYISQIPPQKWHIPHYMLLEQGLLAQLKVLAEDFERGRL
jgi:hypothetical protein